MDKGMFPANVFTGMFSATVFLVSVMVSGFLVTGIFRALEFFRCTIPVM